MTKHDLSIRRAKPNELETVLSILDDAAHWLRQRGIEQWPDSFSGDSTWRIDRIRNYVDHGLSHLVIQDGRAVATFTLTPAADPEFAAAWPDGPGSGGYLFRMAVKRGAAGCGIGGAILDWAAERVRSWGKPWLRLDVHRSNRDLQQYYEAHGFTRVAEVIAPDASIAGRMRGSGYLMQRPTGMRKGEEMTLGSHNWDADGIAATWIEAANLILEMRLEKPPRTDDAWNTALEQAALTLSRRASEIKQGNGMYYRSLTGHSSGASAKGSDSGCEGRIKPAA